MRPESLFPLFADITTLPGVGPRNSALVARAVGGTTVRDCALHLPSGLVDRRYRPGIAEAEPGRLATILGTVEAHEPGLAPRPYKVRLSDPTGFLTLVFFKPNTGYLIDKLPVGASVVVSGEITEHWGGRQMVHPARIMTPEEDERAVQVVPVYPSTATLSNALLQRVCREAAMRTRDIPDWSEPQLVAREGWPGFHAALMAAHAPHSEADIEPGTPARRRLGYDELFARQVALQLAGAARRRQPGRAIQGDGRLTGALLAALPWQPTGAQERAFDEIARDLATPTPMLRLLQGDVGSGKTLVAAWSMARVAEAGLQSALMAPTDILARQHHASLAPLMQAAGLRIEVLTGRDKGAGRRAILAGLADGSIHAVCGTHALFQEGVDFQDLGLVVVDEQHRFGVADRRRLIDKGPAPHVLAMSATPIPRTLALAVFGDLDMSRLDEKPPGRTPIQTSALPLERLGDVEAAVARAVARDDRVYWVCPLVDESEKLDIAAATERHAALAARFGDTVALVHGRLGAKQKDAAMEAFRTGAAKILVATTVIEVGVDVPEASVIVIEHAERFGLAQLHQLRGRVGRGGRAGHCLLLYQGPLGETASERIRTLRSTDDGFVIAEADYRLRGGGDLVGLKQSGVPAFKVADAVAHADLLSVARDDARVLIARDPRLESPRGRAVRACLHLFDQQDAEALIGAA